MMDARLAENIAAVSANLTLARFQDGATFCDKYGDGLGGWIGVLQWFITAAEIFTAAETDAEPFEWYDAIDDYTERIVANDGLPTDIDLRDFAADAISNAGT